VAPQRNIAKALAPWLAALVALFGLLGLSAPAAAAIYDPALEWRTIHTENFDVHYHQGLEQMAQRVAHYVEWSRTLVTDFTGFTPDGRTQVVLIDNTESANGSAALAPTPTMRLLAVAPAEGSTLDVSDDWLQKLVLHEYVHINHLQMHSGFPWFLRKVFGNLVSYNAMSPEWMTEGFATWLETELQGQGGRVRASDPEMYLRMSVLEDEALTIDRGTVQYGFWPAGSSAYFWGAKFQKWLATKYDPKAVPAYYEFYGTVPIPYAHVFDSWGHFGEPFEKLWSEWQATLKTEYTKLRHALTEKGLTVIREQVTTDGWTSGRPVYTADGKGLYYLRFSPREPPYIVRRDLASGRDDRFAVNQAGSLSVAADAHRIAFCQDILYGLFNWNGTCFVRHEYEAATGTAQSKPGEPEAELITLKDPANPEVRVRARLAEISPDGNDVLAVILGRGQTGIGRFHLETGATGAVQVASFEQVLPQDLDTSYGKPAYSPDGRLFAVSRRRTGHPRDLFIFHRDGRPYRRVTNDPARDMHPVFTRDGQYLLFASDRTGITNIYAYELATGATFQVTNVLGGAFEPFPTPDGTGLAFRHYTARGYDIVTARLDRRDMRPVVTTGDFDDGPDRFPDERWHLKADADPLPSSPYEPGPIMRPFNNNWVLSPGFALIGSHVGLSLATFGTDPLGFHGYSLGANYSSLTETFGGSATYRYAREQPVLSLGVDTSGVYYSNVVKFAAVDADGNQLLGPDSGRYIERRVGGTAAVIYPIDLYWTFVGQYRFEYRVAQSALPAGFVAASLPPQGNFGRLGASINYTSTGQYPYAISPEYGWNATLGLELVSKVIGAQYTYVAVSAEAIRYVRMPWLTNHVLALRLKTGFTFGPDVVEVFRLGGNEGEGALAGGADRFFSLRGFPAGYFTGTGAYAATVEYRFPIWRIEHGPWTLPVFVKYLAGTVFADAGNVWTSATIGREMFEGINVSAGAEIYARIALFYAPALNYRLGVAVPLRGLNPSAYAIYFRLGTSF
jgi:hypothetical protein